MLPRTAHLPNARIRLWPAGLEVPQERALDGPRARVGANPGAARGVQRIEHLAVNVELTLLRGAIADTHGA